jgi:hypothetical protein
MLGITQKNSRHSRISQGKKTSLGDDRHSELAILHKFYYETVIFNPDMLDFLAAKVSIKIL